MKKLIVAALLALPGSVVLAQAPDVKEWGKETIRSYEACSFVGTAAKIMNRVGAEDITKSRNCVDVKVQQAKAAFDAMPQPRKPSASAALKDYYDAWIAAMRSVPGRLADSSHSSDSAATSTKQRLNELWARFEIEAGL